MATRDERGRRPGAVPAPTASAEGFAANLKRRQQAAKGLEQDLLTKVPLLYGSPDMGDPGIVLAKIHRDELVRRNGGGIPTRSSRRSDLGLPFEGTVVAIVMLACLFFLFAD